MLFYSSYMKNFGWTLDEVDDTDLDFLLNLEIVESKMSPLNFGQPKKYIEDLI